MRKERIIYVFILSVILLIAGGLYLPKPDNSKMIQNRFWVIKTHGSNNYNILILGDSRAYRGVSPDEIEKYLPGEKILNFAYSSGRLNKFMFKEAEKRMAETKGRKIIVLAISPNSLIPPPIENAHYLEQYRLPREEIIQRLYFGPFLHFFSPLKPSEIIEGIEKKSSNYVQEFYDNGWVASSKIKEDTSEALKTYEKWFKEAEVSGEMIDDLIDQTEKWTKKGILVVGFRIPSSESMEILEDSLAGFDENYLKNKFIKAGGKWMETNTKEYHSYDGSHLHYKSAIKLSNKLGEFIKSLN